MIRILHVFGKLNMGGAETRTMDLYEHIDRTKVQFDFLCHYAPTKEDLAKIHGTSSEELSKVRPAEDFDAKIRSLGGRIFVLPRFTGTNLPAYERAVSAFFASHHDFAAVEGHMTSTASIYLPAAKKAGVPVTIAHARSAGVDAGIRGVATRLFRASLFKKCGYMLSCSRPAALSVFGKKACEAKPLEAVNTASIAKRLGAVQVVPNALDVRSFAFDSAARAAIRGEFGIGEDDIVLGHVGRFDPVKNQAYLAPVLSDLKEKFPGRRIVILFVGRGDQTKTKEAFAERHLTDQVIYAGLCDRERTRKMYQAFDAFVFPSLYEGLPGTVVEAQASGLSCVISDAITDEVCVTKRVTRVPLSNPSQWVDRIREVIEKPEDRKECSDEALTSLQRAGFDIETAAPCMEKWYLAATQDADHYYLV